MFDNTIYHSVFGFLFFLASTYFFDLVCREQYIDSTPYMNNSHISPTTSYEISFFIFFLTGAVSLVFLANNWTLILYMLVQLTTIGFSLVKISKANSKIYPIIVCDSLNSLLLLTLIAFRFFF
jgi:hypothetical protein